MKFKRKAARNLAVKDIIQANVKSSKDLDAQWFEVTYVEQLANDTIIKANPVKFVNGVKVEQNGVANEKFNPRTVLIVVV